MVAAWISAETGVGPSIASGSHVWSGSCADFPHAPRNRRRLTAVAVPTARVGAFANTSQPEPEVAHAVDDERLLARVRGRLARVPEADEEVAAEPDRLPEDVEEQEVPREHQHDHREDEQVEVEEEARVVRVLVHVADRVDVDEEPHARHDQQHHRRELVQLERDRGPEGPGDDPVEERPRERLVREPDAAEREEGDGEGQADRGHRHPVRPVAQAAPEGEVHERSRERQRGDRPDEMDHRCAAIGCGRSAARGAPRAAATCRLTLADPPGGVKADAVHGRPLGSSSGRRFDVGTRAGAPPYS
jgi:hypothetical protein